jgi:hypothetical protein
MATHHAILLSLAYVYINRKAITKLQAALKQASTSALSSLRRTIIKTNI